VKIDKSWYIRPPGVAKHTSCGGVVARRDGNDILVALVTEPGFREYILPKGHLEPGEDFEQAARREIYEEAGFSDLILIKKLGVVERLDFNKRSWGTMHYFLFVTYEIVPSPSDRDHDYVVKWFPVDQLPEMFWPEQKTLIEDNRETIKNGL